VKIPHTVQPLILCDTQTDGLKHVLCTKKASISHFVKNA